jgi:hypothetical protein
MYTPDKNECVLTYKCANNIHIVVEYHKMFKILVLIFVKCHYMAHDKWVPITTAWRVLRLRMEERPPDMEGSCEYIE